VFKGSEGPPFTPHEHGDWVTGCNAPIAAKQHAHMEDEPFWTRAISTTFRPKSA